MTCPCCSLATALAASSPRRWRSLELSARNAPRLVKLALDLNAALRDIKVRGLAGAAATARLEGLVPDLLAVSKCPDFVADRGHLFGAQLTDDDKHALIAFPKRL